ncbi:MAG: sporulation initiation factor Spo0A C-terminal domain-containing protein [Eubacteriales bacterium]|nr:sporulation initiation factor Spo0A C-terminal domain-containing protein [Eubacteriales bacterium]
MEVKILSKERPQAAQLGYALSVNERSKRAKNESNKTVLVVDESMISDIRPSENEQVFVLSGRDSTHKLGVWTRQADYVFTKPLIYERVADRIAKLSSEQKDEQSAQKWAALQIGTCLDALSVPRHLLGYRYILCAVEYVLNEPDAPQLRMMKDVYPYVAKQMGTSPVMADRAMRHAIEVSWNRGNVRLHRSIFGYCAFDKKGMPINAEFIFAIADHLRPLMMTAAEDRAFCERLNKIEASI